MKWYQVSPFEFVSVMASTQRDREKPSATNGLTIDGFLECAKAHHETHVTINEHARVVADVHAGTVVIFGQLTGDILSEGKVSLAKGSVVEGNIRCSCLSIADGAQFLGQVAMV